MTRFYDWRSPASRLVLEAVLSTLAELGYERLTLEEIRTRARAAGPALGDDTDLEALVVAAIERIEAFPPVTPSGDLRRDLRTLLEPWRAAPSRNERVVAAVLSAAASRPRLRDAVYEVLDRPLTRTIGAVVARATDHGQVPPQHVHTLCWVLRAMQIDRLRSGPRPPIDLDLLTDYLLAGLAPGTATPRAASASPEPAARP